MAKTDLVIRNKGGLAIVTPKSDKGREYVSNYLLSDESDGFHGNMTAYIDRSNRLAVIQSAKGFGLMVAA